MAVLATMEIPGGTPADYDRVNEILGIGPDSTLPGLISHTAASTGDGLVIADVWESREAFEQFFAGKDVGAAMQHAGVTPGQVRFGDVHNMIPKGSGKNANVLVLIESPEFTSDLYDQVTAKMPAHMLEGGHPGVSHVAATLDDGGMMFVDVWDSPESFGQFAEKEIGGAAQGTDMPPLEPRFAQIHNRMNPG